MSHEVIAFSVGLMIGVSIGLVASAAALIAMEARDDDTGEVLP